MNYNKLRYFYTVARTLNFTRAAEELYISQSAVSRHMRELEEDFGVPLFERSNRNLTLTDAGKVLFEETGSWFTREAEIYQKVRSTVQQKVSQLNVGFMGIRPAYHIPKIVGQMVLETPEISVNLRRYNWDEIMPALKSEEIDIGLRLRMEEFTDPGYDHHILDEDRLAMVVSANHPIASEKQVSLSDFKDDTFLMLSKKDSALPNIYTKTLFEKAGFQPKNYLEYDQVETILFLIHSGLGVSLLSRFAATDQFPDLKVIELEGTDSLSLELVWKKDCDNPMVSNFIQIMEDSYRDKIDKKAVRA